jgi:hypothetical protein
MCFFISFFRCIIQDPGFVRICRSAQPFRKVAWQRLSRFPVKCLNKKLTNQSIERSHNLSNLDPPNLWILTNKSYDSLTVNKERMSTSRFVTISPSPMEEVIEAYRPPRAREVRGMDTTIEHLHVMLFQERDNYPVCQDYLSPGVLYCATESVNESWRRKLCEWIFEVVDHFGFDREVVSIALDYLDRFVSITTMSSGKPIAKREFQLVAVTSLYIAIKLHGETDELDGPRRKLKISAFQDLSRGIFKEETIEAMERNILSTLKWRMNAPTAITFVAYYLRLLPEWYMCDHEQNSSHYYESVTSRIFDIAKYLTELSVCVSTFTFQSRPSIVAYAATLCAIDSMQDTLPLPYDIRVQFLNNITAATKSLIPGMEEVLRVRRMLQELCPSLFKSQEEIPATRLSAITVEPSTDDLSLENEEESGKISPVCVVEEENRPTFVAATQATTTSTATRTTQRKRIRTSGDE